jgi:hypothetical protein
MIVRFNLASLRETQWYELVIRFALGGAMTVATGSIAAQFGPVVGGFFLAFPTIFPASATLIEKHSRQRKERKGLAGVRRGRDVAALDARGAVLGSIGLFAFALVAWVALTSASAAELLLAPLAWFCVATIAWMLQRRL